MAKSSSFFGLRTGSTKSLTFQVYRGQQITKDRVTRVSNPRTMSQMAQRAKMPLVAAARSVLAGLVDHSWEGVQYGEASLRTFSSKNLANGALTVASFPPNGVSNPGFANFIISDGSLPNTALLQKGELESNVLTFSNTNSPSDAKPFPKMDAGTSGSRVMYALAKFAKDNNWLNFEAGMQITFLSLFNEFNYSLDENGVKTDIPLSSFRIDRFVLPDTDKVSEDTVDINDAWKLGTAVPEAGSNKVDLINDGYRISFDVEPSGLQVSFISSQSGSDASGMAVIFSKLAGDVWKRSPSRILIPEGLPATAFTFDMWKAKYYKTITSTKYLNQGSTSTDINA